MNRNSSQPPRLFFPSVAADGTGNVYVTWIDARNETHRVFGNRSGDHGENWSDTVFSVPGDPHKDAVSSRVLAHDSGVVYVSLSNLTYNRSANFGTTWQFPGLDKQIQSRSVGSRQRRWEQDWMMDSTGTVHLVGPDPAPVEFYHRKLP